MTGHRVATAVSMQVGVKCVRLEGSMAMEQRDRMIAAFTTDASVKVFLMSLKAGGVALNLTAASHVMLMDPWWNPAVEQQVSFTTTRMLRDLLRLFRSSQDEPLQSFEVEAGLHQKFLRSLSLHEPKAPAVRSI